MISRFGDEHDQTFVNVGRCFSCVKHCHEGLEQVRRDFLGTFMKKFHGDPIMSRRLSFRQRSDGVVDFFQREVSGQARVCVL